VPHNVALISTLAVAFGLALMLGLLAVRLRLPALVGYLLAAFLIVLAFRYPLNTALTVSASLAQIGEFSFILAGLGVSLHLMPADGYNLVLAAALSTIALNALVFSAVEPLQAWLRSRSKLARALEQRDDPLAQLPMTVDQNRLTGHVLLVGYGRVGARIGEALLERGVKIVVAEENREIVERLRARGIPAVSGDASDPAVLIQAHVVRAQVLVIAIPDTFRTRKTLEIARTLRPDLEAVIRAHSDDEANLLRKEKAGAVFVDTHELTRGMTRHVLGTLADQNRNQQKPDTGGLTS
jgi:CPA2 family monovalent cation:H+ antiporter-2